MPAPKGNQFWRLAGDRIGRDPKIKTADELIEKCISYFEWSRDNPLEEEKAFQSNGEIIYASVKRPRAMTQIGLRNHLGISRQSWDRYREKEDYRPIIEWAIEVCYQQKLEGAAAGLLNSNIIAREIGLAEKSETKVDSTMTVVSKEFPIDDD